MSEESNAQARQIIAELFGLSPGAVNEHTSRETVAAWDSVQQLNLVLALEQAFDLSFTPDEIERLTSYQQICELLRAKG
jgi:acyl carrier protein